MMSGSNTISEIDHKNVTINLSNTNPTKITNEEFYSVSPLLI